MLLSLLRYMCHAANISIILRLRRHSATGHVATVFGATGFLGRYLVAKLGESSFPSGHYQTASTHC